MHRELQSYKSSVKWYTEKKHRRALISVFETIKLPVVLKSSTVGKSDVEKQRKNDFIMDEK